MHAATSSAGCACPINQVKAKRSTLAFSKIRCMWNEKKKKKREIFRYLSAYSVVMQSYFPRMPLRRQKTQDADASTRILLLLAQLSNPE